MTKKGYVIRNYRQCLKSKMFKLENDITLLFIGSISLLRRKVRAMGQRIRFPLLAPKSICDDKLESKQEKCPWSLMSIQNINCHKILQIIMV
jgi:hypothetical protein